MPTRSSLTLPTTSSLLSTHKLPSSHPSVTKTLLRLSRPSLLKLAREWLKPHNQSTCRPVLGERENETGSFYDPAYSLEELQETYSELEKRKGGKREVVDRILEGDWRDGLSLRQIAMADTQYFLDHPTSQRWVALKLVKAQSEDSQSREKKRRNNNTQTPAQEPPPVPKFQPQAFIKHLQKNLTPLLKAHYHLQPHPTLPLTLLRIAILDSPYNSQAALSSLSRTRSNPKSNPETFRILYLAFPHDAPYIYLSLSSPSPSKSQGRGQANSKASTLTTKSTHALLIDALPAALSHPGERYALAITSLTAKNLAALIAARGPERSNAASGGWSIYADGSAEGPPLRITRAVREDSSGVGKANIPEPPANIGESRKRARAKTDDDDDDDDASGAPVEAKRRKGIAAARFGSTARADDGQGLDKLSVRIEDPFRLLSSATTAHVAAPNIPQRQRQRRRPHSPPSPPSSKQPPKRKRGRRSTLSMLEQDSSIISLPNQTLEEEEEGGAEAEAEGSNGPSKTKPWAPKIQLTFNGTHVFAGLRQLVESGAVDGRKMPGWMTGEEGVSSGVVRGGGVVGARGVRVG